MALPDATRRYPITLPDGSNHAGTVFLKRVIDNPQFQVADYSYASDFDPPQDWGRRLAPYLFAMSREKLQIGKFCQIAHGVRFITASANHAMDGLTSFPFPIFDPAEIGRFQPDQRDTCIGHDVWIGYGALILPGAHIGHGAIIGAGSVVRGVIPPFCVVIGNPARVLRQRFAPSVCAALIDLAWWDWPAAAIAAAEPALLAGDIDALQRMAP